MILLNLVDEIMAEEFTLAPMRRLLKKYGNIKVSEEACEEMRLVIGEYASEIAKKAISIAIEENRKTLLARDVRGAQRSRDRLENQT